MPAAPERAAVCPLHGDKHGTHDCDCPTIGCSQTDAGFMAVFGAVGILPQLRTCRFPSTPATRLQAFLRLHSSHARSALARLGHRVFIGNPATAQDRCLSDTS